VGLLLRGDVVEVGMPPQQILLVALVEQFSLLQHQFFQLNQLRLEEHRQELLGAMVQMECKLYQIYYFFMAVLVVEALVKPQLVTQV
jgi:hypothetical protein